MVNYYESLYRGVVHPPFSGYGHVESPRREGEKEMHFIAACFFPGEEEGTKVRTNTTKYRFVVIFMFVIMKYHKNKVPFFRGV